MRKKVIIIGAGMAGLSAGIHLRRNGYDTLIIESHSIPGGLVTAWKRGNYVFDGSVHWLPGCNQSSNFFDVNDEVLGISGLELVRHKTIMDVECLNNTDPNGDRFFHLYSDMDELAAYMKRISPQDEAVIDEFIGLARKLAEYKLPPNLKPYKLMNIKDKLKMIKLLPLLKIIKKVSGYSFKAFSERFTHPFLKEAITRLSFGRDYPIMVIIARMAFWHQRSAAYPLGGSHKLAKTAEQKYLDLGGKILYKTKVDKIIVADGIANGIRTAGGEMHSADIIISAADGYWTLYHALGGKFLTKDLEDLYTGKSLELFESNVYVSLGLKRKFDHLPHEQFFCFDEPFTLCDGSTHSYLQAHIMSYDPSLAPEGCTVINTMLSTWNHQYWSDLRGHDAAGYEKSKLDALNFVVDVLDRKIGGIRENLEQWDVATPATFIRYTGNRHGSIQGWLPSKDFLSAKPLRNEIPGLKNFYMIGQWIEPGGGITPAIKTGRDVAWMICSSDGKSFDKSI